MAKNDIQFNIGFTVDGDGNLKANMAQLKAMAKETASLSQHTETATKSKNAFNKAEKGAAELTSNSTKAFAKQAQTMSTGTVKAYATLAANIFAVTAAFNALSRAAGVEQLAKGLEVIGNQGGRNLMKVAESLVAITDSAVSAEQAMRTVAVGTSAGFSTTQMERLTKVAKGASLALGRDMSDAMDRLIRGTAKLEPEILDELGIMVRLDDVVSEYAKSIGVTTTAVSAYEKRMAFANAVTEQGEKKFGAIADAIDPNPYSQLSAAFQDLTKNGLNLINTVITPLISIVASSQGLIAGVGAMFASTFATQMLPAIADGADRMEAYARSLDETAKSSMASITPMKSLTQSTKDNIKAMASGNLTAEEYSKGMRKLSGTILSTKSSLAQTEAAGNLTAASYAIRTKKIEHLEQVQRSLNKSYGQLLTAEYKQIQSGALEMATQGELRNSLKQTGLAISSMYAAQTSSTMQVGLMTTGFKTLWTTLKAGTMVVHTLGTAFLSMLPLIGQIIVLGSLVYQAWQWLNKPTEAQKALSELESVVSRTADIASQLDKTLKHTKDNTSAFLAELKAGSGQIESFAQAVQAALDADKAPEGKTGDLYKQLARYQKEYIAYGDAQSKNAINAIQAQIDAWEDTGKVGGDTLRKLTLETNNLVTEISKNPALLAGMGKGYQKLIELQTKLNSSKGSMSKEEVERDTLALLEHSKAYDKINTAIDSSKESQVGYRKELSSLLEVKSDFDGIVSAATARFTEFDKILKDTDLTAEQLTKTFEGLLDSFPNEERLKIFEKGLIALGDAAKKASGVEVFLAGLEAQKEQWEVVRATTQAYKIQSETIADGAEKYKDAMSFSPKAIQSYYSTLNASIDEQIKAIDLQREAYQEETGSLSKLIQLDGERNKLLRDKTTIAEILKKQQDVELANTQRLNEYKSNLLNSEKDLVNIAFKRLEIENEISRINIQLSQGKGSSDLEKASEEFYFIVDSLKLREEIIDFELKGTLSKLDIEKAITEQTLLRLAAEAKAVGDSDKFQEFQGLIQQSNLIYENSKKLATQTADTAKLGLQAELDRASLKVAEAYNTEGAERLKTILEDIASIKFDNFESLEKLSEISFEGLGDYADVGKSLNTVLKTFKAVGKAKTELTDNRAYLAAVQKRLHAEIDAGQDVTAEYQKWSDANVKLTQQENASKTSMMIAYGQAAAGVLMSLAETQDQTSREGFEAAKAMQMGAAVVNTAGAIMNAMATVQPYPAALVAAGVAAATGAMQIATIAKTKFGDSTAPSAGGGMSSSLGASSGNGTVLGDKFKISESASKTDELLEEIHAKEYGKLAIIANEVASLNRNITGLVTNIVRSFGNFDTSQYSSSSNSFMQDLVTSGKHLDIFNASMGLFGANQITSVFDNMLPVVGGLLEGINDTINKFLGSAVGSIFGGETKTKAIEAGLYLGEMTTAQLMTGVYNWVWEYTKTKTKVDGGWLGKDKTYYNAYYEDVNSSIQLMFNQIFSSISTSLVEVTRQLGGDVNKALNYTFESMYINLQGMDSDKINETITGVINETADKAFQAVLEPIIGMYQRLDEGLMETAVRLIATKAIVDEAIKAGSGYTRTLESSSIGAVLRNSLPATSDIINQITLDISNSLTELAGGLKEFQEAFNTYYDAFFTDQEKFIRNTSNLAEVFSAQHIGNLPQTRDSYKQLVAMLDLSTEKGRETYVSLLQLSEKANEYYSYIEEREEKRFELNNQVLVAQGYSYAALVKEREKELKTLDSSLKGLQEWVWFLEDQAELQELNVSLLQAVRKEEEALSIERMMNLRGLSDAGRVIQQQIYLAEDYFKASERTNLLIDAENRLADARKSAIEQIDSLVRKLLGSASAPVQSREFVEMEYSKMVDQITSAKTHEALEKAISSFSSYVPEYLDFMATFGGDYKAIFNSTMSIIDQARRSIDNMPSSYDLEAYNAVTGVLGDLNLEITSDRLLEGLSAYLSGTSDSLKQTLLEGLSIGEARDYYQNELFSQYFDKFGVVPTFDYISGIADTLAKLDQKLDPAYLSQYLTLQATPSYDLGNASSYIGTNITRDVSLSPLSYSAFASGGLHSGGLRLVGEEGPELEVTGPSRIYSNSNTKEMLIEAIREAGVGNGNIEVKVYLGSKEMKDYHIEWHRTDQEVHQAVRREVR